MEGIRSFPARSALAVASGALSTTAYPPLDFGWLVFPALAGLMVSLRGVRGVRARALGFLFGMSAFGIGFSWLLDMFGPLALSLWCVLALFPTCFAWLLARAEERGWNGAKLAWFAAANWTAWEFIRGELFTLRFPWMTNGLAPGANGLLSWIGVYGVGFLVMLVVALLVCGWRKPWAEARGLALLLLAVLGIASIPSFGIPSADRGIKTAGVQLEAVSLSEYLAATRALPEDVEYVVWPEVSVPYDIRLQERDWQEVLILCRERGITLTFGTKRMPAGPSGPWHNIALTVDAGGVRGEHNKVHTVHMFDDGVAGNSARPVTTAFGKIGTPICFDCDYQDVMRKMTAAGAEAFMVPFMDAIPWGAKEHAQHAELFRTRARENGRWVFACGSSGISQAIDPNGRVVTSLGFPEQGVFTATVGRNESLTVFTRIGWVTPWVVLAAAAICGVFLFLPSRKPAAGA
ncbi:MAG: hypothetical protein H7A49_15055 [Akkermansiaceae bacterium]|nr:hypothetical protein [Akkermansiaceae bacterium]